MKTTHQILGEDARHMASLPKGSCDLVVTSPPYPMIEMWDGVFASLSGEVAGRLADDDGDTAFELMHRELDRVWKECYRVLRPGGLACINVGDATRTLGGEFSLWPNHARVLQAARRIGFRVLPDILWRKPTNAPTKFLGSGMLPTGAYVTYEHEYVLVLRKGSSRAFETPEEKLHRRKSAFFWEERNVWCSDVWTEMRGARQDLPDPAARERSAAFPFELPFRLILMHSVSGDTVLDPFLGTGTTSLAAAVAGRSSVGLEIDPALRGAAEDTVRAAVAVGRVRVGARLLAHRSFVEAREAAGKPPKHRNEGLGLPVVTKQETDIVLTRPTAVRRLAPGMIEVTHGTDVEPVVPPRQLELPLG